MFENLQNSSVVWVILSICTILGVPSFIFAIYTWLHSKQKKELSSYDSIKQIIKKNEMDKLDITYNGKLIYDLYITKIAIWNSGNMTIYPDDIVNSRPLSIFCCDGSEILDAEIISRSDKDNEFEITNYDTHVVKFGFKYISEGDGIVVKIVHTGNNGLWADCKIIDGLNIKDNIKAERALKPIYLSWARTVWWLIIIICIIPILLTLVGFSDIIIPSWVFFIGLIGFVGVLFLSWCKMFYMMRKADQRFTSLSDLPRRLRISYEEESYPYVPWYTPLKEIWFLLINKTP